ncbi:hypothetical protein [Luteibaculum oceani]|uniref:Carboxypeptidase-like regulatory domain-containing protein n=1 Tax=Luteibaculum oceani TaxID=1294296 RepID=A0A5C6VKE0_9FLAO|nr:hypothetical protein [Luteibaculum oceani]TXC85141.1 hypothetical protein FRX97_00525 [Luteibaculum oceani]
MKWLLFATLILFSAGLWAQESDSLSDEAFMENELLVIAGKVKSEYKNAPLENAEVIAITGSDTIAKFITKKDGLVNMELDYGSIYQIHYKHPNFVQKIITVDTRKVPRVIRVEGVELRMDVALPPKIENFDYSLLERPIGLAKYDRNDMNFTFDNKFTRSKLQEYFKLKGKLSIALEQ